jgi:hypothetical protein
MVAGSAANVIIGYAAARYLTTGDENVFVGCYAGDDVLLTNPQGSIAIGYEALKGTTADHDYMTVMGYQAGKNTDAGNSYGIFLGHRAGYTAGAGLNSIFVGTSAGEAATAGTAIFLGYEAGKGSEGDGCIYIGSGIGENEVADNKLLIGNSQGVLIEGDMANQTLRVHGILSAEHFLVDEAFSTTYYGGFGGYKNLCPWSHTMENWDLLGGTILTGQTAPNGRPDADKMQAGAGDWFSIDIPYANHSTTYNVSFWAKLTFNSGRFTIDLGDAAHEVEYDADSQWKRYDADIQSDASDVVLRCVKLLGEGAIHFWGWQIDRAGEPRGYCATDGEARIGDGTWSNGDMNAKKYSGSMVYEITEFVVSSASHMDAFDVAGDRTIVFDTQSYSATIGGFKNGVVGQEIVLTKNYSSGNLILEHIEGSGDQKIITPDNLDITITNYGSVTLMLDPDGFWMVTSICGG